MKNKLYFIIVATLLCPTSLYAQSGTDKRSVLSFQTGPTLYTGKLIGIAGYSSNLRNGIGWSGSYTYLVGNKPAIRAGFGMLYQGSRYTGNTTNTTDKIQTHYFAPQFSLHWLKQQFDWYFTTGTGYQLYKDDSMVYDKPRKVSMNKWAANFGVGGEYHLFTHWGDQCKDKLYPGVFR